jgi:hypothetical protein
VVTVTTPTIELETRPMTPSTDLLEREARVPEPEHGLTPPTPRRRRMLLTAALTGIAAGLLIVLAIVRPWQSETPAYVGDWKDMVSEETATYGGDWKDTVTDETAPATGDWKDIVAES